MDDNIVIEKKKRGRKRLIVNVVEYAENKKMIEEKKLLKAEKKKMKEEDRNKKILMRQLKMEQKMKIKLIESENIVHKKRGRKPKGGKIIQDQPISNNKVTDKHNVILHLKCSMSDIKLDNNDTYAYDYNYDSNNTTTVIPNTNTSISNSNSNPKTNYNLKLKSTDDGDTAAAAASKDNIVVKCYNEQTSVGYEFNNNTTENDNANANANANENANADSDAECTTSLKEIWKKITQLKLCFHKNDTLMFGTQRSACFWCTCDFDTPPIYIPKSLNREICQVYGCFCHPECAAAFLINEHIDSSTKFERYHLMNSLYGPIYNYEKSIKPAPNPYYLLSKFYGNLSIQEYRKLFKSDHLVYVVNKPLTHVMPELYEDNNDFIVGNKLIPNNNMNNLSSNSAMKHNIKPYKSQKLNEAFGIIN